MRIGHLLRSVYHGIMPKFKGSIAMITQELKIHQQRMGHFVDVLGEKDFIDNNGKPFSSNLKKYDIILCYESDWAIKMEEISSEIIYVQMNYDDMTNLKGRNYITISEYWSKKTGSRPKVAHVGISPERTIFSEKKENKILYINTLARKKACLDILKALPDDEEIEVMGGIHTEDYWNEIKNYTINKKNIKLHGQMTTEEEKWESLKKAKCVVMAHRPEFGEESGCIVQIEAKFAGTPVIAFGEIFKEMTIHGKTGFIANDWDDFRKYIKICNTIDPYDCLRDGLEKYRAEDMAKKHINIYNFALEGHLW